MLVMIENKVINDLLFLSIISCLFGFQCEAVYFIKFIQCYSSIYLLTECYSISMSIANFKEKVLKVSERKEKKSFRKE